MWGMAVFQLFTVSGLFLERRGRDALDPLAAPSALLNDPGHGPGRRHGPAGQADDILIAVPAAP